MKLFDGLDLKKCLCDDKYESRFTFTGDIKINIIFKICRAIWYLHFKEVIHRNIKPGNLLINNNFDLKLSDFGISGFQILLQSY